MGTRKESTAGVVHDFTKQDGDADCTSQRALGAKKCVECCKSAYLRSVQIMEPLEQVTKMVAYTGWERLANDLEIFLNGGFPQRVLDVENAVAELLQDAGFDVEPTDYEAPIEAFAPGPTRMPKIVRVRPKRLPMRRVTPPPPNEPRRISLPTFPDHNTPVVMPTGTAFIELTPGWSLHPLPVLQQLIVSAKVKVATRVATKDCCDCVAKRVWKQSVGRKSEALKGGGRILRRAPGGAKP